MESFKQVPWFQRHLLTATHTAAEMLSEPAVRGLHVIGGNVIANVIEWGKNEIPPLF